MGLLDGVIPLALYAAFGIYVLWGILIMIVGAVYMSDVGEAGTTGVLLCLIGFAMLFIGGIAIFANMRQWWWLLLIVELINVVLFLVSAPLTDL